MRTRHFLKDQLRRLVGDSVLSYRSEGAARKRLEAIALRDEITPYGLELLAALELHAGDAASAIGRLSLAIERRASSEEQRDDTRGRFLLGYAKLDVGEHDAALELFDGLSALENDSDEWKAPAHQGRGDVLSALDRLGEARDAYRASADAASDDEFDAAFPQLDVARVLAELGEQSEAKNAAQAIVNGENDNTRGEARYLLATLLVREADKDGALVQLTQALDQTDDAAGMRARANADPSLEALKDGGSVISALEPPVVDTRWLDAHPLLLALRDDVRLGELGVRFVSETRAREGGDSLRKHYESLHLGTLWTDALVKGCKDVANGLVLLAEGPTVNGARHSAGLTHRVKLYASLERPEQLWLAPHADFPALLFTELPADGDTVVRAVRELFLDVPASAADLTAHVRAFMGYIRQLAVPNPYSGDLEEAGPHELDRHFNFSPALDPLVWGGAHDDDPWPDVMPAVGALQLVNLSRERRGQLRGSVARLTHRAQFSRAHVGYEIHAPSRSPFYVWDIRYRPNPFPRTIARANRVLGTDYPTDLPADVVVALIGFDWFSVETLRELAAKADPGAAPAYYEALAAIRSNDLSVTSELFDFVRRPDSTVGTRARIANVCLDYGWRALLEEMALFESDQELRGQMVRILGGPMPEVGFSEMGEPENLYGGGADEEEEEDEDDDE